MPGAQTHGPQPFLGSPAGGGCGCEERASVSAEWDTDDGGFCGGSSRDGVTAAGVASCTDAVPSLCSRVWLPTVIPVAGPGRSPWGGGWPRLGLPFSWRESEQQLGCLGLRHVGFQGLLASSLGAA